MFWLEGNNHIDPDSLPPLEEVAEEIIKNLEAALERFGRVVAALKK